MRNTCSWGLGATKTFRNKSKKLRLGNITAGTNLQNPSDRICRIYEPDEKKIYVQGDCAGADARIVAYLCPAGLYRDLFIYGVRPHSFTCLHIFSNSWKKLWRSAQDIQEFLALKPKELSGHPNWKDFAKFAKKYEDGDWDYVGKKSGHSYNYKQSPQSCRNVIVKETEGKVVLELSEVKRVFAILDELFPEIKVWWAETEQTLRAGKPLVNLFGHPFEYYGMVDDKTIREAVAWNPQSTVGCITNKSYVECQDYIEDHEADWDMLNQKHDSNLIQCLVDEHLTAAKILKTSLEQTLTNPKGEKFTMKSEVSVGYNWGKHSDENPNGLREISI